MTSVAAESLSAPRRTWSRYRHPESTIRFAVILAILAFLGWSVAFLNIDLSRVLGAFPRLAEILATRYFPPDVGYVTDADFVRSVIRTLEMSLLGGFLGAHYGRRLSPTALRVVIVVVGSIGLYRLLTV